MRADIATRCPVNLPCIHLNAPAQCRHPDRAVFTVTGKMRVERLLCLFPFCFQVKSGGFVGLTDVKGLLWCECGQRCSLPWSLTVYERVYLRCRRAVRLRGRYKHPGTYHPVNRFGGTERGRAFNIPALVIAAFDVFRQVAACARMGGVFAERAVKHDLYPRPVSGFFCGQCLREFIS